MFKLWFVKFEQYGCDSTWDIAFCFTLPADSDKRDAENKGLDMINSNFADRYRLQRAEIICNTPDEVLCFEPC